MGEDTSAALPGRRWAIVILGQPVVFGLAVWLLDRAGTAAAVESVRKRLSNLPAADTGTWIGFTQYEEAAARIPFLTAAFFMMAAVLFVNVAAPLWHGSPRAVAAALLFLGLTGPLYLTVLAGMVVTDVEGDLRNGLWSPTGDIPAPAPGWYAPGRAATLGAAAMAYLMSVVLLTRAVAWRPAPAPRMAPLILSQLPLLGLTIPVLDFVAIGQAGPLADGEVRAAPDYYADGKFYLENAAGFAWTHTALFAVAGVVALMLALLIRRFGVSPALLAVQGAAGFLFLLLLLAVSVATPFSLSGAADEPVSPVLGSGPDWYLPAVLTQTVLCAVAYTTTVVWQITFLRRGPAGGSRSARPLDVRRTS
ncbi:hypothetical protein [Planobispora longispora]|uniref:Uncharacterized protein n=1 Tax=Planobispora longispora TaxID=28887 RepID=A0A8J3RL05_9ACTN|nr:hypothetical protein [Planobispora longispora]GIH78461.1 hypothetical protein Plo01_48900 [Planobispora longispora]